MIGRVLSRISIDTPYRHCASVALINLGMLMWLMIRDGEVGQDGDMEGDLEMRCGSPPIAEARASGHDESALEA
jgi:hypothetical protein